MTSKKDRIQQNPLQEMKEGGHTYLKDVFNVKNE